MMFVTEPRAEVTNSQLVIVIHNDNQGLHVNLFTTCLLSTYLSRR